MTPDDVRTRVAEINDPAVLRDAERGHGECDALFEEVLRAIAAGAEDPAGLAQEALKALDLPIRWYYA